MQVFITLAASGDLKQEKQRDQIWTVILVLVTIIIEKYDKTKIYYGTCTV